MLFVIEDFFYILKKFNTIVTCYLHAKNNDFPQPLKHLIRVFFFQSSASNKHPRKKHKSFRYTKRSRSEKSKERLLNKDICDALHDWVLFPLFKKREKHQWDSVIFSKGACFSLQVY